MYTTQTGPTSGLILQVVDRPEAYEDFVEQAWTCLNVKYVVEIMEHERIVAFLNHANKFAFGFTTRTRLSDPAFMGTKEQYDL